MRGRAMVPSLPATFRVVATLLLLVGLMAGCRGSSNASETELQLWMKEQAALVNRLPTRLSVTAELGGSRSDPTLRFHLVNRTTETLELYKGELPWSPVSENGLDLFAISASGQSFDRIFVISHYGPDIVEIPSAASLEGEYPISHAFLGEWTQQDETLLLWTWKLPRQLNRPREVATGYVIIPGR